MCKVYIDANRLRSYNGKYKEVKITPASKAQQKAVHKYVKENYDRIGITLPKGRKDEIKAFAEAHNESVNAFIVRAIGEAMREK